MNTRKKKNKGFRRLIAVVFLLLLNVIVLCYFQKANELQEPELRTDDILEDYLYKLESLKTPVREYGDTASYDLVEDDIVAQILYPVGEVEQLTEKIDNWIKDNVAIYRYGMVDNLAGETVELTIGYSSYVTRGNMIGVKFEGTFSHPELAHPINVIETFHANSSTKKLICLKDILTEGGVEKLVEMVAKEAGIEEAYADEGVLNHWILLDDGLEVTLARGDYLPMSEGTKTVLLSNESLNGILNLEKEENAATVNTEENTEANEKENQEKPIKEQVTVDTPDYEIPKDDSAPKIALTFDDGPSRHTDRLLDVFASWGGKGTFFVVGNTLDQRPDTLRRMAAEGHEIGGHSWDHRQLTKLGPDEIRDQMMNTRASILNISGVNSVIVRPPYGSCNDQVKAVAAECGISLINWSVDTLDWKYKDSDYVYRTVMDQAEEGAIILCHDLHQSTVDAMERVIPDLIAKGYQLVTVSELLNSKGIALQPGSVYRSAK